jgi:hypothetical protein
MFYLVICFDDELFWKSTMKVNVINCVCMRYIQVCVRLHSVGISGQCSVRANNTSPDHQNWRNIIETSPISKKIHTTSTIKMPQHCVDIVGGTRICCLYVCMCRRACVCIFCLFKTYILRRRMTTEYKEKRTNAYCWSQWVNLFQTYPTNYL